MYLVSSPTNILAISIFQTGVEQKTKVVHENNKGMYNDRSLDLHQYSH